MRYLICVMLFYYISDATSTSCIKGPLKPPPKNVSKPILYLIDSYNSTSHKELNEEFIRIANSMYYKVKIVKVKCEVKVNDTIEAAKKYEYLINLRVTDFYNNNYNDLLENNLKFAGDLATNRQQEVVRTNKYEINEIVNETLHDVKIISNAVADIEALYEVIGQISEKLDNTVLVCLNYVVDKNIKRNIENTFKPLKLVYAEIAECKQKMLSQDLQREIFAVLTPKYFDIDEEYLVPTVFYQTFYMAPEYKSVYVNSVNVIHKWQPLKYAVNKFIEVMDWNRVAIVSDHTPFSEAFNEELTSSFSDHGVVYTLQQFDRNIEAFQVLKLLNTYDTRVIFVNADHNHTRILMEIAKAKGMNNKNYAWILRDTFVFEDDLRTTNEDISKDFLKLFAITLGPDTSNLTKYIEIGIHNQNMKNRNFPYISSIIEALTAVKIAYDKFNSGDKDKAQLGDTAVLPEHIFAKKYKIIKNLINEAITKDGTIKAYFRDREEHNIKSMNIRERDGEKHLSHNLRPFPNIPTDLPNCLSFRSHDFFAPCSDLQTYLLVGVGTTFLCLFFVIVVFFDLYKGNLEYSQFL